VILKFVRAIVVAVKLVFLDRFLEKCSNMKFHENAVVRADLFHMDVQTSSHYEALSRFSQFSEGAKKEIV